MSSSKLDELCVNTIRFLAVDTVLPRNIKARKSIEAGSPLGWERYVGDNGVIIGIPHFGASAPGKVIYEKLGLTAQHVADEAENLRQGGEK